MPSESAAGPLGVLDQDDMPVYSERAMRRKLLETERLVRERVARTIEAERERLRTDRYPADAQWLRALDSAAAIARDENR